MLEELHDIQSEMIREWGSNALITQIILSHEAYLRLEDHLNDRGRFRNRNIADKIVFHTTHGQILISDSSKVSTQSAEKKDGGIV